RDRVLGPHPVGRTPGGVGRRRTGRSETVAPRQHCRRGVFGFAIEPDRGAGYRGRDGQGAEAGCHEEVGTENDERRTSSWNGERRTTNRNDEGRATNSE